MMEANKNFKDNKTEVTKHNTREHWENILHDSRKSKCLAMFTLSKKQYSTNTSKTHLKDHTISCLSYVTQDDNQTDSSSTLPIDKKDVDNSIIDPVVGAGFAFQC